VTLDAMGCQKASAQKIQDRKAEYVLALKGNQRSIHGDVKLLTATMGVSRPVNTGFATRSAGCSIATLTGPV